MGMLLVILVISGFLLLLETLLNALSEGTDLVLLFGFELS